jgi:hypothetical protein
VRWALTRAIVVIPRAAILLGRSTKLGPPPYARRLHPGAEGAALRAARLLRQAGHPGAAQEAARPRGQPAAQAADPPDGQRRLARRRLAEGVRRSRAAARSSS